MRETLDFISKKKETTDVGGHGVAREYYRRVIHGFQCRSVSHMEASFNLLAVRGCFLCDSQSCTTDYSLCDSPKCTADFSLCDRPKCTADCSLCDSPNYTAHCSLRDSPNCNADYSLCDNPNCNVDYSVCDSPNCNADYSVCDSPNCNADKAWPVLSGLQVCRTLNTIRSVRKLHKI